MRIAHDALVLVADGRKSLFFRNEGDEDYPNLVVEDQRAQAGLDDRDMKTDAPGRAVESVGARRSAMEEPDYHQLEEDRFARETAELLAKRAQANGFDQLVVVAPPRALGELRKHYDKAVQDKIVAEVDKDLVNHPVDKLEAVLKAL